MASSTWVYKPVPELKQLIGYFLEWCLKIDQS